MTGEEANFFSHIGIKAILLEIEMTILYSMI